MNLARRVLTPQAVSKNCSARRQISAQWLRRCFWLRLTQTAFLRGKLGTTRGNLCSSIYNGCATIGAACTFSLLPRRMVLTAVLPQKVGVMCTLMGCICSPACPSGTSTTTGTWGQRPARLSAGAEHCASRNERKHKRVYSSAASAEFCAAAGDLR